MQTAIGVCFKLYVLRKSIVDFRIPATPVPIGELIQRFSLVLVESVLHD